MRLPKARGDLSSALFSHLGAAGSSEFSALDPTDLDDAQISLWVLYELHHRGFEDVDESFEWDPALLAVRRALERDFEATLRERYELIDIDEPFADGLFAAIAAHDGPSIAAFVKKKATREQTLDILRWRSIYHLKESDPVAWVVPRLTTAPKAALMELQFDEYGGGNPARLHAQLFADGMAASGLSPEYGAYLDDAPLEVLELNNAMVLFGLHRRLRGAAMGHLAAFEATSSLPSRAMAQGLARLEFPDAMVEYYTEHIEADAVHEQLAVREICAPMAAENPALRNDIVFGAFTCLDLESRFAARALELL